VLLFCFLGKPDIGEKLLQAIRVATKPRTDDVRAQDYVAIQTQHDGPPVSDSPEYAKTAYLREITPELVETIVEKTGRSSTEIALSLNGGAIADVEPTGSAVAHRRELFQMEIDAGWEDPSQQFTSGFYANLTVADQKAIDDNYGPNRARLMQVKRRYDPITSSG
jgi:hypothetical protein